MCIHATYMYTYIYIYIYIQICTQVLHICMYIQIEICMYMHQDIHIDQKPCTIYTVASTYGLPAA